jgi:hypothetical protein
MSFKIGRDLKNRVNAQKQNWFIVLVGSKKGSVFRLTSDAFISKKSHCVEFVSYLHLYD